ncbi:EamA family transporter RarD [Novosphingobium sp.]|uniref:EamA family transporter RarD n=1 Tax=Novosphingobium sp. TaxID=1874826 RepID=UPI002FDCA38A
MKNTDERTTSDARGGLAAGLLAYLAWGLFPLYFHTLQAVPATELVSWRVICTLPVCLVMVVALGEGPALLATLRTPALLGRLVASAVAVGSNWLIYLYALASNNVLAASLGYYINPLLNVVIGVLFLGERLNRPQWIAAALALTGTMVLASQAPAMIGLSLSMALSFTAYGLIRRFVTVSSVVGLTVETLVLYPLALFVVWHAKGSAAGWAMAAPDWTPWLLAASGLVTAGPLLLFAAAARKLDLSVLGFIQFISPTIVFILGLTLYGETMSRERTICFALIWCAIAVFAWDMLRRRPRRAARHA